MKYVASSVTQEASAQNNREQTVWMRFIHTDKQYVKPYRIRLLNCSFGIHCDKKKLRLTVSPLSASFCSVFDADGNSVALMRKSWIFGKCVNFGCDSVIRDYCFNFCAKPYLPTPEMFIEFPQHSYEYYVCNFFSSNSYLCVGGARVRMKIDSRGRISRAGAKKNMLSMNWEKNCRAHEPIFTRNDSGIYSFDLMAFRNSRVHACNTDVTT